MERPLKIEEIVTHFSPDEMIYWETKEKTLREERALVLIETVLGG